MNTLTAQRITAAIALHVAALATLLTLGLIAVGAAPQRVLAWSHTTRRRGDVVGWVILAAGAATMAIMIVGYLTPKVQEYLNRIQ